MVFNTGKLIRLYLEKASGVLANIVDCKEATVGRQAGVDKTDDSKRGWRPRTVKQLQAASNEREPWELESHDARKRG